MKEQELKDISHSFHEEFKQQYEDLGNVLITGIAWKGEEDYYIAAMLRNSKGKKNLPLTYQGVPVKVRVIGVVRPL